MGRRNQKSSRNRVTQAAEPKGTSWLKSTWVVGSFIVGLLFTALLNAPTLLENLRKLPASYAETKVQFLSWLHEDEEWTGNWTTFPEGVIEIEEMNLSEVDMQLTIWASQGKIDGIIGTRPICKQFPFWAYVLLRGEVSGDSADVIAFDYILGKSTDFAKLRLDREGDVLTITPLEGMKHWFPPVARLGRSPLAPNDKPEPDMDYCAEERKVFQKQMEELARRPEK